MRSIIISILVLFSVLIISGCTNQGITEEDRTDINSIIDEYFSDKNMNESSNLEVGDQYYMYDYFSIAILDIVPTGSNEVTVKVKVNKTLMELISSDISYGVTQQTFGPVEGETPKEETWEFKLRKENEEWKIIEAKPTT